MKAKMRALLRCVESALEEKGGGGVDALPRATARAICPIGVTTVRQTGGSENMRSRNFEKGAAEQRACVDKQAAKTRWLRPRLNRDQKKKRRADIRIAKV